MTVTRDTPVGSTRNCPHCRTQILASAVVCPACRHHLRFGGRASDQPTPDLVPLKVSGTLRHEAGATAWEYSVVVTVRNAKGEEVARQVVGVGALAAGDERTFSLAVEVYNGR